MYTVGLKEQFIARHHLTCEAPAHEKKVHAHSFELELEFTGRGLDDKGYLLDIDEIKTILEERLNVYRDAYLNELPQFNGLNPSIENFSRILCEEISSSLTQDFLQLKVVMWEDRFAWASYCKDL